VVFGVVIAVVALIRPDSGKSRSELVSFITVITIIGVVVGVAYSSPSSP